MRCNNHGVVVNIHRPAEPIICASVGRRQLSGFVHVGPTGGRLLENIGGAGLVGDIVVAYGPDNDYVSVDRYRLSELVAVGAFGGG